MSETTACLRGGHRAERRTQLTRARSGDGMPIGAFALGALRRAYVRSADRAAGRQRVGQLGDLVVALRGRA